ncbi:MAG: hypothetical protein FDZ70_09655 [Actinobacteria bacterium]|nr:MAG: hypothetical protein FDZ70_09655 [Actinomycetota bacterium]
MKIVASAFCGFGGLALISMIADLVFRGVMTFEVFALMLPVGVGLFQAKPSSRKWATFWAVVVGVWSMGLGLYVAATPADMQLQVSYLFGLAFSGSAARLITLGELIGAAVACGVSIWILYTPAAASAFDSYQEAEAPADLAADSDSFDDWFNGASPTRVSSGSAPED